MAALPQATKDTHSSETFCFNVNTVRRHHTPAVTWTAAARRGSDHLIEVVCLTSCNLCAENNGVLFIKNEANSAFDVLVTDDDLLIKSLCCLALVRLCMFMINDMVPNWNSLSFAK